MNDSDEMQAEAVAPKTGESWYVMLKGASTLSAFKVTDVTRLTVALDSGNTSYPSGTRYKRSDVEFVEKY